MKALLIRFCRWVLSDEIINLKNKLKSEKELSERLAVRLLPYKPPLLSNGEGMTEVLKFHMDISTALREPIKMPLGEYKLDNPLIIGNGMKLEGEKNITHT